MQNECVNEPIPNVSYKEREGVYGIVVNENRKIGIIKTSTGYFLPGGGIEENEEHEECLRRECIEEAAMKIQIGKKLSIKSYYFYSTLLKTHMLSKGHFYECTFNNLVESKCEEDHELVWLEAEVAVEKLYLLNQKVAVGDYMNTLAT